MNLYGYQQPHAAALCAAIGRHGAAVDASDTGTGKSPVACTVASTLNLRPAIVCPKTVVPSWRRHCAEFGLDPVFVETYEMLRNGNTPHLKFLASKAAWLVDQRSLLIFDEVHRCGGHQTLNSLMLRAARKYGIPTLALSATIADSPLRLAPLAFVLKLHNGNEWNFLCDNGCIKNFHGGIEFPVGKARPGTKRARQIARAQECLLTLHKTIFPEHGSRMRISEIPEFPKTRITAEAVDFGDLDAVYAEMRKELANVGPDGENHLTVQLRARERAELMRVPALVEMTQDGLAEGQSVVIFVNFRSTLAALAERFPDASLIHGEQKDREMQKNCFTRNETRVCICTIQAGGTGLDLHDIDGKFPRLALICPTWSATELKQALGRVWRATAKSTSIQRILFAAGTVEEEAFTAVRRKLTQMDTLQDGDLSCGLF